MEATKDKKHIVIFGGPGSGKGTQSAKLIDEYGLHHISTGDVLRDHICAHTDLGRIADKYISQGQLIPDKLMLSILEEELDKVAPDKAGVIFDGFPRTIPQALALNEMLEKRGSKVHCVIGLEVPDEELTERLVKRGRDSGRSDDNPETIKKRLEVYHNQTTPLRELYKERDKYLGIDGHGTVDDIFGRIADSLEKKAGLKRKKK